ncbi:hypothetical protein KW849_14100 [Pseudomonas sp. PDM26]|uniref:hypothetical protein n=1 Tax=Pseudomonas sp. PDM26 TaxID=2854766 RepID=UPI001C45632B|nr:hypothetical protein [Pseudomonas sp. PDM26]MBV7547419.1 hypothetical protein [Pseudomonas sp. PDM26]
MLLGQIRSFVYFIGCENTGLNFLKVISVGSIRFLGFILWFWVVAFWAFPRVYSAAVVIEDGTIIGIPPEICQTLNLPVEKARCKFRGELQGTLRLTWEVVSEAGRGVELEQGKYPLAYAKSRLAGGGLTEFALFAGLATLLLLPETVLFLRRRRAMAVASA